MTLHAGENFLAGSSTPIIFNKDLTLANTEYSQTLPVNTRKYSIKSRQTGAGIKLSYTEGESGTTYISVPDGGYWEDLIGVPNLTLYFQSPISSTIVEIVAWS